MPRCASFSRHLSRAGAVLALALFLCAVPARGLVLYGMDDLGNTSNPNDGSPWTAVGSFTDSGGSAVGNSCIYLGNGYVLTANHVSVSDWVKLDGTVYARDTGYTPVQIASGVDAKVFHLASVPVGLQGVELYGGTQEANAAVNLIAWGVGRDPADTDMGPGQTTVSWGSGRRQRWGVNVVSAVPSGVNVAGYVYDAVEITFDADNGASEAALADGDSGSGMFAFLDGKWQLIALNTAVSTNSSATFGGPNPDTGIGVRISSYRSEIVALIPEPSGLALFAAGAVGLLLYRPRRRRAG